MPRDSTDTDERLLHLSETADPVGDASMRSAATTPASASDMAEAERLAVDANPAHALELLIGMIERHPQVERLQLLAVRVLERLRGRQGSMAAWRSLLIRFPRNHDAVLVNLRWLLRTEGPGPAARALAAWFPDPPQSAPDMLLLARGLEELGEPLLADAALGRLFRQHPSFEAGWMMHVQIEERRGRPWLAKKVAETGVRAVVEPGRLQAAAIRLTSSMAALDATVPPALRSEGTDVSSLVLARLVEKAAAGRISMPAPGDALGPVVMIGGSLGAGGAERQMVATAIGLQRAHLDASVIAGKRIGGVQVICRSIEGRPGAGFFAPDLEANRVGLQCYSAFPEFGGGVETARTAEARALLRFLSPRVAEGTARLTDVLRAMAPRVVHLWQDGTILACALASLLAGVPRIVLSVRTAPPQDRPERSCPEYALLYPLLARIPGVVWTTNSAFSAARYADTIGMDQRAIRVVPNGVGTLPTAGSSMSRARFARFDARHGPGFTVGAVMRMDDNKRPLDFVDCAARLLVHRPDARFILVGDGPLRSEVEARAAGLGDRILFTGRSTDVGFWLSKMDALMMLSRFEGLPNAVLEAQISGVPVVATPAGGTAEAMQDGRTGYLLSNAITLDQGEVVARLLDVAAAGGRKSAMARAARRFVSENFSISCMLERTVESYVHE